MAMGPVLEAGVESLVGLTERVADAIVHSGASLDPATVSDLVHTTMRREAPLAGAAEAQAIIDLLVGLGPVEALLRDASVTDVFVNGPSEIWIDAGDGLRRSSVSFADEEAVRAAIERVITPLGLRIDRASPIVDARLPDGSRLHAVIPPASVEGPLLAIRRFTQALETLDDLIEREVATVAQVEAIRELVSRRQSLIVSGGTGSGKTTLLNLIGSLIDPTERVVVIEDASELALPGHVVRLESQPPNTEGRGAVTIAELVRSALRLRPDRIVVGEVRGDEALDLVSAINTGHAGSMSTIHANSPDQALWRLETLALSGTRKVSEQAVHRQIRGAIEAVIQISREGGRRRITSVGTP